MSNQAGIFNEFYAFLVVGFIRVRYHLLLGRFWDLNRFLGPYRAAHIGSFAEVDRDACGCIGRCGVLRKLLGNLQGFLDFESSVDVLAPWLYRLRWS